MGRVIVMENPESLSAYQRHELTRLGVTVQRGKVMTSTLDPADRLPLKDELFLTRVSVPPLLPRNGVLYFDEAAPEGDETVCWRRSISSTITLDNPRDALRLFDPPPDLPFDPKRLHVATQPRNRHERRKAAKGRL